MTRNLRRAQQITFAHGKASGFVFALAVVAAFLLVAGPARAACDPDKAVIADDFEDFLDPSWGEADESVELSDGVLLMKTAIGRVNSTSLSGPVNVCSDAAIKTAKDEKTAYVGVLFWMKDGNNYYLTQLWDNGVVQVVRVQNGRAIALFFAEVPNAKKGLDQFNTTEVQLRDKSATLLINGKEVKRFKGVPPKDNFWVGLAGGADANNPSTFVFDNFIVTDESQ